MTQILVLVSLFLMPAYIFRFSLPAGRLGLLGIPTNIFEVAVGISVLVFIIECLARKNKKKFVFGLWPAYILLLAAIIGVMVAPDKTAALGILKGWFFIPTVLCLIIINSFDKKNLRLLTIPLFISLMLVSIWAILQKLGVITTLFYQVGDAGFSDYIARFRAFGPFESPNYLAMFLVPVMFLTLPIFGFIKRSFDQVLFAGLYVLPLFALYASHSLGGLLAFGFGTISLLAFWLAKEYRARLINSGPKITALAILLVVTAIGFAAIFSSISHDQYSNTIRLDIYHYSIDLAKLHSVSGVGLGEFQRSVGEISASNAGFQLYGLSYALHPHNVFLALWLNLGILGVLAFLYLLGSFFWKLARRGGDVLFLSSLFAAMVAIIVHGLVDTTYFKNDLSAIFWLILACGLIIGGKEDGKQI